MDSKFTRISALRDTDQGCRSRLVHRYAQVTAALVLLLFSTGILVFRQVYLRDRTKDQSRYNNTTTNDGASRLEEIVEMQRVGEPDHAPKLRHAFDQSNYLFGNTEFVDVPFFDSASITAVLPVTSANADRILDIVEPLLLDHSSISALILICPQNLMNYLTLAIKDGHPETYMDISVSTWLDGDSENWALLNAASQVHTEYLLVLGQEGLTGLDDDGRNRLITHPILIDTAYGFCGGARAEESKVPVCTTPQVNSQDASFLLPPFVLPSALIHGWNASTEETEKFWALFGSHIAHDNVGGIVQESTSLTTVNWCLRTCQEHELIVDKSAVECPFDNSNSQMTHSTQFDAAASNTLAIILPTLADFQRFSSPACRFLESGYDVRVLIRSHNFDHNLTRDTAFPWLHDQLHSSVCDMPYSALHSATNDHANAEAVTFWLSSLNSTASVVIYGYTEEQGAPHSELKEAHRLGSVVIAIPQGDLPFCDWLASLSLRELRGWHIPDIEITVVTDVRPHSLSRLLRSINTAKYYGDGLKLRINMEQSVDAETRQIVSDFEWPFGPVYVHHRVIHAGLLPSIVESWYPHTNDTYGIILEDDVEVSPLFYAWVKMVLLRYRYGESENRTPSTFGISLYQQKVNELRPEGRRPFDAHKVFASFGLSDTNTPYLSQVPCSWGAVYFPEHWREFHAYLNLRFSDDWLSTDEQVVPHVRSNKWRKSWKKFFIEMVYLRGYAMLYPNYDGFLSLSTNHLEVGSHVKEEPKDVYDQKKLLFTLPLIPLNEQFTADRKSVDTGLLDLPKRRLPSRYELPVLDLLGEVSSSALLEEKGAARQIQMSGCRTYASDKGRKWTFNAEDLFACVDEVNGFSDPDRLNVY